MCLDVDCGSAGKCIAGNCICDFGYAGETCNIKVCESYPCHNNGTCLVELIDDKSAPLCQCSHENKIAKYHGENCEMPGSNFCGGSPCQNGGSCTTIIQGEIQACFIINES